MHGKSPFPGIGDKYFEDKEKRWQYELERRWDEVSPQIPYLRFKPEWKVAIIPPSRGADVRFCIACADAYVSVYLDIEQNLGFFGGAPYWEVYDGDDIERCDMTDGQRLMELIERGLTKKEE